MSVRVKICGLTRLEDARAAAEAGAWALGFIFYPPSKRYVAPEKVREILDGLRAEKKLPERTVGVFVNMPRTEIARILNASGVNTVQLHGDETVADCRGWNVPVIKALRLKDAHDVKRAGFFRDDVNYFLTDAAVGGAYGGTGTLGDWDLARQVKVFGPPLLLSGGITPENAAEAWRNVRPFALDLASGVEEAPGLKSKARIDALFRALEKEA